MYTILRTLFRKGIHESKIRYLALEGIHANEGLRSVSLIGFQVNMALLL